jgi:flavin reductase (DIM6/NTAB) family NADH-FMN oxidoreductase RutF
VSETDTAMDTEGDGDTDVFEQLMASLDPPMYVLTAYDGEERSGCLVGFATQVSIQPTRFLIMISKQNHTCAVATAAPVVVVHVLRLDDAPVAQHFGELSGDDVDKFEGLDVIDGPGMAPVLVGVDWFAGRVLRTLDLGDHVGLLLAPHDGSAARTDEAQYGLRDADDLEPGHPA